MAYVPWDHVAAAVAHKGPVGALYHFEEAEAVARKLAAEARERRHYHTEAGLLRAADLCRSQQFELVERYAGAGA
jgi:hypothetical protein